MFCPGCGKKLDGHNAVVSFTRDGELGHDCYCKACGWSGDVLPDEPLGARVSV